MIAWGSVAMKQILKRERLRLEWGRKYKRENRKYPGAPNERKSHKGNLRGPKLKSGGGEVWDEGGLKNLG